MQVGPFRPRDIRVWDGLAFFWLLFWLVIGVVSAVALWRLSTLSAAAVESGRALDTAGTALQRLSAVPVVGEDSQQLGDQIREAAAQVSLQATEAERSIRLLAVLIGAAVALIPATPVLCLYLPWRVAHRRHVLEVRDALADPGQREELRGWLAARAVASLPWPRLRAASHHPVHDLAHGRWEDLARAELDALGLPSASLSALAGDPPPGPAAPDHGGGRDRMHKRQ